MPVFVRTLRINVKSLLKVVLVLCVVAYGVMFINSRLENENIEALSWSVANKVIVIDPGHGGKDPGVVEGEIIEKEVTLAVAEKLATILGHAGAVVILTRETDMELTSPGGRKFSSWKREDLNTRISMANDRNADLFVSVHVNSFRSGRGEHGAQTFSQPGSEESKKLAETIQGELVRILGNNHRKAKQVDYYILRNAKMPAVIVEIGFITNPKEGELLQNPAYQSKVAYAIYTGIVKYFSEQAGLSRGQASLCSFLAEISFSGRPGGFLRLLRNYPLEHKVTSICRFPPAANCYLTL